MCSLQKQIEQHKPWLTGAEVKKGIEKVLGNVPESGEFPRESREEIQALFRKASPWDAVKDAGEAAIPAGDATRLFQEIVTGCKRTGLWIVPVGELEGFCKSVGKHGPAWVQGVIAQHDLGDSPDLQRARDFVKEIWSTSRLRPIQA